jgi:hypothetical protein
MKTGYDWRYFRTARLAQVKIENGEDLAHLAELDRKLWTALSSPTTGVRFDTRMLTLMDTDGDGRIRVPEVLAAIDFLKGKGVNLDDLFKENPDDRAALDKVMADQADLAAAEPSEADKAALKAWEDAPKGDAAILPLGDATAAAEAALAAVEAEIDAFFAVPDDLPLVTEELDKVLPLTKNLNPKWAGAIATFATTVAGPVLGKEAAEELTRLEWSAIKAKFAPYRAWQAAKPVMAADTKAQLEDRERLLRYKLNLVSFLRNYVNQADLYDPACEAMFQMGTLYIAERACSLCFHVDNEAAHAALAERSECCLVYAKLTRKGSAETRQICAAITAGCTAPLYVGRNGIFFDRDGLDWDATVTKIVEAQVSLKEAFWAPWRKLGQTVAEQVKKFIGDRQTAATAGVTKAADGSAAKEKGGNAAALAGSVAALGVGIGMMGAAFAGLFGLVAGLPWWKTAIAVVAVLLAVSLPSVILTWFKLRRRDLGAILNAGGWAANRPLRFSNGLAREFTRLAVLPPGAYAARDPYSRTPWKAIIATILVALAILLGWAWKTERWPFCPKKACAPAVQTQPAPAAPSANAEAAK